MSARLLLLRLFAFLLLLQRWELYGGVAAAVVYIRAAYRCRSISRENMLVMLDFLCLETTRANASRCLCGNFRGGDARSLACTCIYPANHHAETMASMKLFLFLFNRTLCEVEIFACDTCYTYS